MACPSDDELVEYAEGLASLESARAVALHVDACETCRAVLAGLARALPAPPERHEDAVPAELVHEYLRREAPHREQLASGFFALLSLVGLLAAVPVIAAGAPAKTFPWVLGLTFPYQVIVYTALRRGHYHRALPFLNAVVEVSTYFAIEMSRPPPAPPLMGGDSIILGAIIVFSAIRADRRVCMWAGGIAALEWLAFVASVWDRLPPLPQGATMAAAIVVAVVLPMIFCVCAGAAGATIARYFVTRAEAALREIRTQDLFGKYVLHERLGTGGMGEVYRATYCPEGGFSRKVAVKRVREDLSSDRRFVEAFRSEARLSAMLAHPNLVQVLDFGTYRGALMLAMEYVDGIALNVLLRRLTTPLAPAAVAYLGAEIAGALDYVHQKLGDDGAPLGLVHCDVNPPNVLLSKIGEVKLADFGVARAGAACAGKFVGKTSYAAPEQLRGEPLDATADLFGLGLTMYLALTQRRAFEPKGSSFASSIIPPAVLRPDIPAAIDALVLDLLALDRTKRPPSAAVVRERLLELRCEVPPYPAGRQLLAVAVASALGAERLAPVDANATTRDDRAPPASI